MKKIYTLFFAALAGLSLSAQQNVTFNVDMTNETVNPTGVHIAGNFQDINYDGMLENADLVNWNPSAYELTDADMDGVYSITLQLISAVYEFKFINGNNWNDGGTPSVAWEESIPSTCTVGGGNSNRQIVVAGADATYSVCFANCAACGENAVRFAVDMTLVDEDGDGIPGEFGEDINPVGVYVAGEFQGWNASATPLYDFDSNGIWEGFYSIGTATTTEYKFINGNDWSFPNENVSGACSDGTGNRVATVSSANTVLPNVCWNSCDLCVQPTMVTFMVDMSQQAVSPNGVYVAGSFQNWTPGEGLYHCTDNDADGIFQVTVGLQPGNYQYKFVNGNAWSGPDNFNETIPADCASGGNRALVVGTESVMEYFCYGQCGSVCIVDPDPADITFRVNMNETPVSTNGVWVISNATNPQWQAGATQMTDDNADGIYEATFTVSGSADFFYKFVNGDVYAPENEEGLPVVDGSTGIAACGVENGLGGYNRTYTRSGVDEVLNIVCFNECADCEVSVSELSIVADLKVFPVPAIDVLNVSFNTGLAQHIVINVVNNLGQVVVTKDMGTVAGQRTVQLDVENLATGIYALQITNGNNKQVTHIAVK